MSLINILLLIICCLFSIAGARGEALESEGYKMEHVAGVWQRGYIDGPADGAMFESNKITLDGEGNIFVMDSAMVRVISKEGRVWTLAGNGIRGFRDGPADEAMFNVGGRGYPYCNLAVDSKGNIYVPDGYNNRIRRIYKRDDGKWFVETYSGGAGIKNPVSVAVDVYDNVWTEGGSCIYKITPSGQRHCYRNIAGNVVNMQADRQGNVYLLVRQGWASNYWKVSQDGKIECIAGMKEEEVKDIKRRKLPVPVDGPASKATFFGHGTFGVTPDGRVIYGGNGDEHILRRIKDGESMSLFREGWKREEHNRDRGWAIGGPVAVDNHGRVYIIGNNPPYFLWLRRLVPLGGAVSVK